MRFPIPKHLYQLTYRELEQLRKAEKISDEMFWKASKIGGWIIPRKLGCISTSELVQLYRDNQLPFIVLKEIVRHGSYAETLKELEFLKECGLLRYEEFDEIRGDLLDTHLVWIN